MNAQQGVEASMGDDSKAGVSGEQKGGGGEQKKEVKVQPASAADELGRMNPSSPAETGTTPGSNGKPIDGTRPKSQE
jgi:hypothetical protein